MEPVRRDLSLRTALAEHRCRSTAALELQPHRDHRRHDSCYPARPRLAASRCRSSSRPPPFPCQPTTESAPVRRKPHFDLEKPALARGLTRFTERSQLFLTWHHWFSMPGPSRFFTRELASLYAADREGRPTRSHLCRCVSAMLASGMRPAPVRRRSTKSQLELLAEAPAGDRRRSRCPRASPAPRARARSTRTASSGGNPTGIAPARAPAGVTVLCCCWPRDKRFWRAILRVGYLRGSPFAQRSSIETESLIAVFP